jgi:undecaprenyl-diphosphatase
MPDWIAVVLLGIIEGITEFLPVSSTGHLLIAERWLAHRSDLFNVVIQCGAVIAVLPLFPQRCRQLLFVWRDLQARDFLVKLGAAFVLTGIGGWILEKKHFKLPEEIAPVAVAMFVGGILFVLVEAWLKGRELKPAISWPVALLVGVGQLLAAVFPGTSRSGATILIMLVCGVNRPVATEFSFLVGVPTMLAAGGLKIFKALRHTADSTPENWGLLGLCTVVSAIVSFLAVKWLLRYVQTHSFAGFGWYRIVFAACLLLLFFTHG